MTMYVEVQSRSIEKCDDDGAYDYLLEYVLNLRGALPHHNLGAGVWSGESLACEVAYDQALINLAAREGIDVAPIHFAHPLIERQRLEFELAEVGIDLDVEIRESQASTTPGS